ncbi:uncharacterized protein LOC128226010 isoform X2 [Mya arenaria]|uniref:uncharacterized protein LOC128226010 isoform X2 n=1 Tax=Mya arenaria TaxID=6604 RepID=UPI0022E20B12|nr:uncharacterized protein LOC128226010 isoform X2 [Mya arenaria]XP_052791868.1 uncharacterized protein LOC128226010 isoform X2 [Mya arenaria]XP_052791869.1 uncharacterized protein LOC128226010 isoform X2 [Mya arenaria]
MSWIFLCAPSIIWTAYWLNSFLLTDSCTYDQYDDCPAWGSCTAECGGGIRSRTCKSCFWKLEKDFTEYCNRFCYNGYNFSGGKCQCSDWRNGRCCENCNLNYNIPHCPKNKLQCGGKPDGIRCELCNDPYYAAGYGNGCRVCPSSIHQCKYRRCRSRNNVYCKKCYEDNIIFKRYNNDKECQRMCSWNNHFCWPGRCGTNELTKDCQCASGFRKVEILGREIHSGETSCQPTQKPFIETCNTEVIGPIGEKKDAKSSTSTKCSYLQDMYGNFQPSHINFKMVASYHITLPAKYSKPRFIYESRFGITDTAIYIKRQTVSGSFTTLTTHKQFTDYHQSQMVEETRHHEGKIISDISRKVLNGEALCLTYEAKGGGFLKAQNVKHTILNAVPFKKQTTERTICYRYDSQPPEHCSKLLTCGSEPLQVDKRITRSTLHHIEFNGWVDPVPRLGASRTASKIESYEVRVNEVMPSNGTLKVDYTYNVIPSTIVNHTVKSMDINLTANAPRLYCITLEVKDVADNVRQCRRFVLFDNTSSIKIWNEHPFRFTSASPGTNYTWQTHHNDVCLSWKDYFYNNFYIYNELLNPIEPLSHVLITGSYDQITGELPVSGTSNVYGIIAYNVSWRLNHGSFSEEKPVPSFNNQSICKNLNVKDGDTYTVNVKAIDIVGNTLSDSRTVFIDRSAPHLNNVSLEKDGYEVLFVHKSSDLSDMKMTFDAFDPHSGLSNIYWTFGIADTMTELLNEHLGVRTTNNSCSSTLCYCPDIGDCAFFRNTLPLYKLQVYAANMGHHYKKYYFTIKVTNMAGLSTTEHINFLVHDSLPSEGVVYEGREVLSG